MISPVLSDRPQEPPTTPLGPADRRALHLAHFRRHLTEQVFPPPPVDDGLAPDASRFSSAWRNGFGLLYVLANMRAANGGSPYPDAALEEGEDRLAVTDRDGHRRTLVFRFDDRGDVEAVDLEIVLADGLRLRDPRPEDHPVLEALEAAAGIPFGDGHCFIERRGSLEDALGLLGDGRAQVVEDDQGVLAFGGVARVPVAIDGVRHAFHYAHHYRILERGRRRGLVRVLSDACDRPLRRDTEGVIAVVHEGNVRGVASRDCPWQTPASRLLLRCADVACESRAGRSARREDGPEIAAMLNHAHRGEQWFCEYTPASLEERLSRRPEAYGWEQLVRTDRAVLGIWWSGEVRRFVLPDREWTERRAVVMDTGFVEGGEAELVALLRSLAGHAAERDVSHLSVTSSEGARGWPLLLPLAERAEAYFVSCTRPEPPGTATQGLYLDPVLL